MDHSVGEVRAVPCVACLDRIERNPGKSFCHDKTGNGIRCAECARSKSKCENIPSGSKAEEAAQTLVKAALGLKGQAEPDSEAFDAFQDLADEVQRALAQEWAALRHGGGTIVAATEPSVSRRDAKILRRQALAAESIARAITGSEENKHVDTPGAPTPAATDYELPDEESSEDLGQEETESTSASRRQDSDYEPPRKRRRGAREVEEILARNAFRSSPGVRQATPASSRAASVTRSAPPTSPGIQVLASAGAGSSAAGEQALKKRNSALQERLDQARRTHAQDMEAKDAELEAARDQLRRIWTERNKLIDKLFRAEDEREEAEAKHDMAAEDWKRRKQELEGRTNELKGARTEIQVEMERAKEDRKALKAKHDEAVDKLAVEVRGAMRRAVDDAINKAVEEVDSYLQGLRDLDGTER